MKLIYKRFKSLLKSIVKVLISQIESLYYRYRILIRFSSIWKILWLLIKLFISMNIIFAFPVPFLFEPLNGIVNFFKDLFDGLMEAYFKAYFWIKERISGISKPNIPEIPRRKDKIESWEYRKPKYDPEVLSEEEEYLRRKFYKNNINNPENLARYT